jgi:hypothetical protein
MWIATSLIGLAAPHQGWSANISSDGFRLIPAPSGCFGRWRWGHGWGGRRDDFRGYYWIYSGTDKQQLHVDIGDLWLRLSGRITHSPPAHSSV